ncbi:hypothetical protein DRE_01169 [Drechslerella stenobrocha 248]|uniref:Uncharacterized protein n=1 Tax=Drechslerella stenobrocha 248 TaxID=1043628 RepID=W7HWM8_9PEZI|nr:hypothetical protein DRE_01169 [Drechslerella stenobrocha 248]
MSTPFSIHRIHWYQPTLMVGSLIAGLAAAVGHHFFYLHRDGRLIDPTDATGQEWTLRIGTGLAFLVRACFSLSLGTALVQCFWDRLESNFYAVKMRTADRAFEIGGSPVGVVDIGVWGFSPVIGIVGVVYWLLPLAMIIPPASLTVNLLDAETSMSSSANPSMMVYHYNARNLFIAYIIGGSLTSAGCIAGLLAMLRAGRAFSNNLSTVIRVSRNEALDDLIDVTESDGASPLPDHLAASKIKLAPVYGTLTIDGERFAINVLERGIRKLDSKTSFEEKMQVETREHYDGRLDGRGVQETETRRDGWQGSLVVLERHSFSRDRTRSGDLHVILEDRDE